MDESWRFRLIPLFPWLGDWSAVGTGLFAARTRRHHASSYIWHDGAVGARCVDAAVDVSVDPRAVKPPPQPTLETIAERDRGRLGVLVVPRPVLVTAVRPRDVARARHRLGQAPPAVRARHRLGQASAGVNVADRRTSSSLGLDDLDVDASLSMLTRLDPICDHLRYATRALYEFTDADAAVADLVTMRRRRGRRAKGEGDGALGGGGGGPVGVRVACAARAEGWSGVAAIVQRPPARGVVAPCIEEAMKLRVGEHWGLPAGTWREEARGRTQTWKTLGRREGANGDRRRRLGDVPPGHLAAGGVWSA